MLCSEFRELLDRYESIDELDRECMDAHCDFCDDCRSEMEFFKAITNISASIPCPAPPKTLIAEVNAKLDTMAVAPVGGKTKSWSIKQYATLAACLAVGIAVGINGGYIKDRLSDNSGDGVITQTVISTETEDNTEIKPADVTVGDDKPASSAEKHKVEKNSDTEIETSAPSTQKPQNNEVKPIVTPSVTPEATVAPTPEAPAPTPSVNDYAVVGEGQAVAYYSVGSRNSASKAGIADYILVKDVDMAAVFGIMSELGVSSSDGYYMTTRTVFYQMLEKFDTEGIECDYQLIYNTGENIAFKLRYSVAK